MITSKIFHINRTAKTKNLLVASAAANQLIPEQSTATIIIHHRERNNYSVGESRVEQLMKL